jgi:hypothetical protein
VPRDTTSPEPATEEAALFETDRTLPNGPVDAAPVDTAPVDTAPVDTAPVDTAPVDRAVAGRAAAASGGAVTGDEDGSVTRPRYRTPLAGKTPTAGPAAFRMTAGDELEMRLARMAFWKGAYARRGVNLGRHFHPEPLVVTDLDLLAIDVTSGLGLAKTIGEAKSGTGKSAPKPLDRAIWIAGLKPLVGATGGILVTASPASARVRDTAATLGVTSLTVDDLQRWETTHLPAALHDVGSHGPGAFAADHTARAMAKGEPSLERVYWFLKSEVWFLDPWQSTKRLIGAVGELRRHWTPDVDDGQAAALRWMYAESLSILTLQLVALVGIYQTSNLQGWPAQVKDRLAEGAIPAGNQHALANAFDKYLAHILGELNAPSTVQVEAMGAFHPIPPDWADALIELLTRLESFNGLREFPRLTDLVLTERIVRRRHVHPDALAAASSRDPEEFARLRRQIAAFLRGCLDLPEAIDKALTT